MKSAHWLILIILAFLLTSCKPSQSFKRSEIKNLDQLLSATDMNHHMGFLIKELESGHTIKSINSDQYFTPASNTKIVSLALGLEVLGDSIPWINYYSQGDTLYIQGLGDPTFLHPDFSSERQLDFLKSYKSIVLDQSNFKVNRYGSGWSWDDYNGAYQVERSSFPMYGHYIHFEDEKVSLSYFNDKIIQSSTKGRLYVQRGRRSNTFNISGDQGSRNVPLVITNQLTRALLQDTLGVPVVKGKFNDAVDYQTYYSHHVDTLYEPMMVRSDNFFADQIVLISSQQQLGQMNESKIFDWAKKNAFESPDELLWFDGSGLSRYNQFTPRSMVYLFESMEDKYGLERLLNILAHEGTSGTIEDWYSGADGKSYVFAKTGTLRNVHCLSGFLKADSGKWYVFSFMHNNFPGGSSSVKKPMEKILSYLKSSL